MPDLNYFKEQSVRQVKLNRSISPALGLEMLSYIAKLEEENKKAEERVDKLIHEIRMLHDQYSRGREV